MDTVLGKGNVIGNNANGAFFLVRFPSGRANPGPRVLPSTRTPALAPARAGSGAEAAAKSKCKTRKGNITTKYGTSFFARYLFRAGLKTYYLPLKSPLHSREPWCVRKVNVGRFSCSPIFQVQRTHIFPRVGSKQSRTYSREKQLYIYRRRKAGAVLDRFEIEAQFEFLFVIKWSWF